MPGKILIVDDIATNRIVLRAKLTSACYETLQAHSGRDAIAIASGARPDLVLLDYRLPDLDGISVTRALRANPETADIPIVMFTASKDTRVRLDALRAGVDAFLPKPLDDTLLLARIRRLMRDIDPAEGLKPLCDAIPSLGFNEAPSQYAPPGRIAVIAPRDDAARDWQKKLSAAMPCTITVLTRKAALALTVREAPDIFVIIPDTDTPEDGLHIMSDLCSRTGTRHTAFCMILPTSQLKDEPFALDLGAHDVFGSEIGACEAALRLRIMLNRKRRADRQRAAIDRGLRLAILDPLTGLHNRRYALPIVSQMVQASVQRHQSCAAMLIDIDKFKSVNDSLGHAAGDAVLIEVTRRLQSRIRQGDLVSRIGGEEFLVVLPDTTVHSAMRRARQICSVIQAVPIMVPEKPCGLTVTVSIGLAFSTRAGDTATDLIARADQALLLAKADGRNQVTIERPAA